MTTERRPRPRRRHAAAGARVLATGVSVSAAIVLAAAMAGAAGSTQGANTIGSAPSSAAVARPLGSDSTAPARERVPAPRVTRSSSPPVTASRAS